MVVFFKKIKINILFLALSLAFTSCGNYSDEDNTERFKLFGSIKSVLGLTTLEVQTELPVRSKLSPIITGFRDALTQIELTMISHGLVDIHDLDSEIVVDLKYASEDNFLGRNVYEGLQRAYLQPDVARMLVRAQRYLKSIEPEYSLIVFDAARPRNVQQKMWDAVDAPFAEKIKFLANPANGSIHNFGAAVDVSIIDIYGVLLDMGADFDDMDILAYPTMEQEMLEQGRLQPFQVENRRLLMEVMRHGGFWGIQTEWWHFNACSRAEARERYEIIE